MTPLRYYAFSYVFPSYFLSFLSSKSVWILQENQSNRKEKIQTPIMSSTATGFSHIFTLCHVAVKPACRNVPCVPPSGASFHPLIWRGWWKTGRKHTKRTLAGPHVRSRTSQGWGNSAIWLAILHGETCMGLHFSRLHRKESRPGGGREYFFPLKLPFFLFPIPLLSVEPEGDWVIFYFIFTFLILFNPVLSCYWLLWFYSYTLTLIYINLYRKFLCAPFILDASADIGLLRPMVWWLFFSSSFLPFTSDIRYVHTCMPAYKCLSDYFIRDRIIMD